MNTEERLALEKTLVTCDGIGKDRKEENLDKLLRDSYARGQYFAKRPRRNLSQHELTDWDDWKRLGWRQRRQSELTAKEESTTTGSAAAITELTQEVDGERVKCRKCGTSMCDRPKQDAAYPSGHIVRCPSCGYYTPCGNSISRKPMSGEDGEYLEGEE